MSEDSSRRIFSENLKRIMTEHEKTAANLNADLGIPFSTLSNWTKGLKMPRMGKIELLCNYFHCEKSDLLEEHKPGYYLYKDTAKLAQEFFDDPDMRFLFHAKKNMTPERFQKHIELMKDAYRLENPDDDYGN